MLDKQAASSSVGNVKRQNAYDNRRAADLIAEGNADGASG